MLNGGCSASGVDWCCHGAIVAVTKKPPGRMVAYCCKARNRQETSFALFPSNEQMNRTNYSAAFCKRASVWQEKTARRRRWFIYSASKVAVFFLFRCQSSRHQESASRSDDCTKIHPRTVLALHRCVAWQNSALSFLVYLAQ